MKRVLKRLMIISLLFLTCFLIAFLSFDKTKTIMKTEIDYRPCVYVTLYGEKYHSPSCHYLHTSKTAKGLYDAQAEGYTVCSYCHGVPEGIVGVEKEKCVEVDNTFDLVTKSTFIGICITVFLFAQGDFFSFFEKRQKGVEKRKKLWYTISVF